MKNFVPLSLSVLLVAYPWLVVWLGGFNFDDKGFWDGVGYTVFSVGLVRFVFPTVLSEWKIGEKNTKEEPDYNICPCCGGLSSDPVVPVKERGKVTRVAGGYKIELTEDQKESLKADVSFIPGLKGKE